LQPRVFCKWASCLLARGNFPGLSLASAGGLFSSCKTIRGSHEEDSLNYCLYHIIKYKCLMLRFDSTGPEPCGIHSYKIKSLYHNAASCKFQLHFHNWFLIWFLYCFPLHPIFNFWPQELGFHIPWGLNLRKTCKLNLWCMPFTIALLVLQKAWSLS
jgi:hypothetical protein